MNRFIAWNRDVALPAWASHGFDPGTRRFAERLDQTGRSLPVPHRAMVQARQIYVYAHAAALGWYPPGADLAEAAMASLRRDHCRDVGTSTSVAFSVDPASGAIVSPVRDSYTHAFVLFAIAHLHRLNGDPALLDLAERITRFVEEEMTDAVHGGVVDALPESGGAKRQNPQMHLLEAYLALEAAAPGRGYRARADVLVDLFYDRMTIAGKGVLIEHFAADWGRHHDPSMAEIVEPGHHYEWSWLLDRHEALGGRDHSRWIATLDAVAREHGHAPGGLIFDSIDPDRRVTGLAHRLWPHTEAIKAAIVRHRRGDPAALGFAGQMADVLTEHFLDRPFAGGWTDRVSAGGAALADHVPASSLYHLFLAATEAANVASA